MSAAKTSNVSSNREVETQTVEDELLNGFFLEVVTLKMGNDTSNPAGMQDAAARARQQQLQELQDISSDYLVQLESIIDSRAEMEDPRDVIAILKSNLRTAREQIERISSQAHGNGDSPLPNASSYVNGNNDRDRDRNSNSNNNNKLQLAPTDSDSTNASFRSWLSKVGPLNGRIAYGLYLLYLYQSSLYQSYYKYRLVQC